jgi:hypothetical protein
VDDCAIMTFSVISIDKKTADRFVIAKHYSRRASIFWAGFGLIEDNKIMGVVVYGQPSPPVQRFAFIERDFRLYELSRLVIQTSTKNAASFLVGNSLKLLEKPSAVVSYADMEQSHCGFVYQATNWMYTGATVSHDHAYLVDGKRVHPITLRDRGISDPKRWAKENGIETIKPAPKHRYFFLNGSRSQKKEMKERLKYSVINKYPKCDPVRYDDGPEISMLVLYK